MLSNKRFVLLGCTADIGPAKPLLLIPGMNILGVARGGQRLDDLLDFIRYNAPDDTTFRFPKMGADLMNQGPSIAQWILDQTSEKEEIVLVPLASLEGEQNVRVCAVMDLIIQRVTRQRRSTILVQYSNPTTPMVLPPTASTSPSWSPTFWTSASLKRSFTST